MSSLTFSVRDSIVERRQSPRPNLVVQARGGFRTTENNLLDNIVIVRIDHQEQSVEQAHFLGQKVHLPILDHTPASSTFRILLRILPFGRGQKKSTIIILLHRVSTILLGLGADSLSLARAISVSFCWLSSSLRAKLLSFLGFSCLNLQPASSSPRRGGLDVFFGSF